MAASRVHVLSAVLVSNVIGFVLGEMLRHGGGSPGAADSRASLWLGAWVMCATFLSFVLLRQIIVRRRWKPWQVGMSVGLVSAPSTLYLTLYSNPVFGGVSAGFLLFGLLLFLPYVLLCTLVGAIVASLRYPSSGYYYVAATVGSALILASSYVLTLLVGCSAGC